MATVLQLSSTSDRTPYPVLRPTARWVPVVDERGRSRLEMQWRVPDVDEALRAVVAGRA